MPIDIQGKDYYTVVERMQMLKDDFKINYSLKTDMLLCDDKKVVVKAVLSIKGNEYTGLAMELIGGSFINKYSALENCETSAIGRALSSAGYFGTEFCSANELENAIKQQKEKPATKKTKQKQSGGMSEQHRLENEPDYSDKDELTFTDIAENLGGTVINDDPKIKYPINFGKHKGSCWTKTPVDYVNWVAENSKVAWQKDEAKAELARRAIKDEKKLKKDEIPF